jgi:hypothetical protein
MGGLRFRIAGEDDSSHLNVRRGVAEVLCEGIFPNHRWSKTRLSASSEEADTYLAYPEPRRANRSPSVAAAEELAKAH